MPARRTGPASRPWGLSARARRCPRVCFRSPLVSSCVWPGLSSARGLFPSSGGPRGPEAVAGSGLGSAEWPRWASLREGTRRASLPRLPASGPVRVRGPGAGGGLGFALGSPCCSASAAVAL